MVAECARDRGVGIPISGIGGISTWQDVVEFMLMGATGIQVCTAVMHHGFRILEEMIDGLNNYLDDKGLASVTELIGKSVSRYSNWGISISTIRLLPALMRRTVSTVINAILPAKMLHINVLIC